MADNAGKTVAAIGIGTAVVGGLLALFGGKPKPKLAGPLPPPRPRPRSGCGLCGR